MVLESVSRQYRVLRQLRRGDGFQSYLCSYSGKEWVAVWFESTWTESLFPYFEELEESQRFQDLADIFSWREGLVIVLACRTMDHTLKDAWEKEEDISYEEKLRLAGDILTGLCIGDLPLGIAVDLLKTGNAGVCTDGVPGFFYDLHTPGEYPSCTMRQLIEIWCQGMERLFLYQIQMGQGKELEAFFQKLRETPPDSVLALYQLFLPVRASLEEQIAQGKFHYEGRGVQIWKMVKKGVAILKKVIVAAVLLGAIVFLFFQLWQNTDLEQPAFQSIGTVELNS